jgi:general secretion pathway protein G
MRSSFVRAFTLVEILIVVVLLGILAAIVVPMFSRSSNEARAQTTYSELEKIRRHIEVYQARNSGAFPTIEEDNGTWGEIVGPESEYLKSAPVNAWVGGANAKVIHFAEAPDEGFHTDYGWIYNSATGDIWAGGFDANDQPFPRE